MVSLQGVKKDRKLVVIKFFAIFENLDHNTGTQLKLNHASTEQKRTELNRIENTTKNILVSGNGKHLCERFSKLQSFCAET